MKYFNWIFNSSQPLPVTLEGQCTPLRRKSVSAPPQLASVLLSDCLNKAREATGRVTRLHQKTLEERKRQDRESGLFVLGQESKQKSKSLIDFHSIDLQSVSLVGSLIAEMVETAMEELQVLKKIRTCHQCHAPLSESLHAGVASGVGVCPLEHWKGCPGGIEDGVDGHGKPWAGCIRADDLDKSSGSEQVEHDSDVDISDADTE